jgi:hypothetical protein
MGGLSASSPRRRRRARWRDSSSTTWDPSSSPRPSSASAAISAPIRFRDLRRHRALHPHDLGTLRTAHGCAVGARHAHQRAATAGWSLALGLRPWHRGAVSGERAHRRISGCLGQRYAAPRSCCAARSPTCCRPHCRGDGGARAEAAIVEFADVGHAPMLLSPEQIEPVARFLRTETAQPSAVGTTQWNARRVHCIAARAQRAVIAYNRGRPCRSDAQPSAPRPRRPIRRKPALDKSANGWTRRLPATPSRRPT